MARQANANERPVTLHPGSCALHLCALAIASGSLYFRKGPVFSLPCQRFPPQLRGLSEDLPRGIAIGDGAHHWTLCHDAALLHAGLGGRSNSPWPTIPYLLLIHIVNTRGTRVKKNIRPPREIVNDRSSTHLFPTVVPCGRNPPPGPPYSKLNCRYFSQDEKVFVRDRSRLDKPEGNEIRCGI